MTDDDECNVKEDDEQISDIESNKNNSPAQESTTQETNKSPFISKMFNVKTTNNGFNYFHFNNILV